MIKCPNCQTDILDINMINCHICGSVLRKESPDQSDDNDYKISESDNSHLHKNSPSDYQIDDLGIESNSDLIEKEASDSKTDKIDEYQDNGLIGDSAAPIPSPQDENQPPFENNFHDNKSKFSTLSDEDVKKIEQNLYKDNIPSADEKASTLERLNHKHDHDGFDNSPIIPPKNENESPSQEEIKETEQKMAETPKPLIAKKGRGVAYFYKNFIELSGSQRLHEDDELIINQREYLLKPKAINTKVKYGFIGTVFIALLVFAGSFFMRGNATENGLIVGVALDENEQPFLSGATITLPELGKSATSDAQGFFKFTNIPPGPHKIRYIIGKDLIREDYITVVENQTSLTLLLPDFIEDSENYAETESNSNYNNNSDNSQANNNTSGETKTNQTKYADNNTNSKPKSNTNTKTKNTKTVRTQPKYSKVSLNTNVNNAKLIIDGAVMGAGDLTYSNIKPGKHSYLVSSDGYESVKGNFSVRAGQTKDLSLTLKPLVAEKKEKQYSDDDFFYSAQNAFNDGDYKVAVSDINRYIDKNPSNADAYFIRAKSYASLKDVYKAYDDFIQAAEIYQIKKNYNRAITCYNKAIDMDDKQAAPYLGRGNLYLNKREYIAAVTDFDKVISLDKRNFYGYYGMGEALFMQGRYSKAINFFKDARSIDDKNPLVHQYLMLSYLNDNDIKNVMKSYDDFENIASTEEMMRFESNSKYAAVRRIVDTKK